MFSSFFDGEQSGQWMDYDFHGDNPALCGISSYHETVTTQSLLLRRNANIFIFLIILSTKENTKLMIACLHLPQFSLINLIKVK
jgi:hypothetical protein